MQLLTFCFSSTHAHARATCKIIVGLAITATYAIRTIGSEVALNPLLILLRLLSLPMTCCSHLHLPCHRNLDHRDLLLPLLLPRLATVDWFPLEIGSPLSLLSLRSLSLSLCASDGQWQCIPKKGEWQDHQVCYFPGTV